MMSRGRARNWAKALRLGVCEAVARLAVLLLPPGWRYRALLTAVRGLTAAADLVSRRLRGRPISPLYAAELLRDMLGEASVAGGVAVPLAVANPAALEAAIRQHGGRLMLFTAHFYLSMAVPEALRRRGLEPLVIAGYRGDLRRLNWFDRPTPPALVAEDGRCLVRARRALVAGRPVALCPDTAVPLPGAAGRFEVVVNPNSFRFAEHAGAGVLLAATRLRPDGAVEAEFALPPASARSAAALIEAYCAFMAPRLGAPVRPLTRHEPASAHAGAVAA